MTSTWGCDKHRLGFCSELGRSTGLPPGGELPDCDGHSQRRQPPPDGSLSLVTSTPTANYTAAGQTIDYNYLVTNNGGSTLTSISIADCATLSGNSPPTCPSTPRSISHRETSETCNGHVYNDRCRRHRWVSDG